MTVTLEEIRLIVSLLLGTKEVTEEQRLVEDLGAESADVANIIATLEEKFKIFISEEMIAKIRTVGDLYSMILKQVENREET